MDFTLRPFCENDASSIAFYANNQKIARFLRDVFPFPYHLKDAQDFLRACIENEGTSQYFRAIVIDSQAVGSIGVSFGADVAQKSAELGYWLGEPFWGHGKRRGLRSSDV